MGFFLALLLAGYFFIVGVRQLGQKGKNLTKGLAQQDRVLRDIFYAIGTIDILEGRSSFAADVTALDRISGSSREERYDPWSEYDRDHEY